MGLCLSSQLPWIRGILFIPVQLIASLCAGGLVSAMFPVSIADANSVLGGGTSVTRGLFLEMFFTALLTFVVLMLAAEKSKDTFLAPIGIGLALFVAMIAGTLPSSVPLIAFTTDTAQVRPTRGGPSIQPETWGVPWHPGHSQVIIGSTGWDRFWEHFSLLPFIAWSRNSTMRKPIQVKMRLIRARLCRGCRFEHGEIVQTGRMGRRVI